MPAFIEGTPVVVALTDSPAAIEVELEEGYTEVTLGAFHHCESLREVRLPQSVTHIRGSAFLNCAALTSVTVPESVISIERRAFDRCENLTELRFEGTVEAWKRIQKAPRWFYASPIRRIVCADGELIRS